MSGSKRRETLIVERWLINFAILLAAISLVALLASLSAGQPSSTSDDTCAARVLFLLDWWEEHERRGREDESEAQKRARLAMIEDLRGSVEAWIMDMEDDE